MTLRAGIDGLRVLVTGASSGVGEAAAEAFAAAGAKVCVHFHSSQAQAESLADRLLQVSGHQTPVVGGDLTLEIERDRVVRFAVEALGGLDCLVNNAGGITRRALSDVTEKDLQANLTLNLTSPLGMSRSALSELRLSDRASIVNVGSVAALTGGSSGAGSYAAAKAALHSLTRSMAREFAPLGIRVNTVAPGVISTPFHDETPKEALASLKSAIPLGRLGEPSDCAPAFVFLASPVLAGYVTGQTIHVNGGMVMP